MFKTSQFYQHSLKANKTKNACFTKFVVSYRAAFELYAKISTIKSVNVILMVANLTTKNITRSVITDLVMQEKLEPFLQNRGVPHLVFSRDDFDTVINWKETVL